MSDLITMFNTRMHAPFPGLVVVLSTAWRLARMLATVALLMALGLLALLVGAAVALRALSRGRRAERPWASRTNHARGDVVDVEAREVTSTPERSH